MNLQLPLSQVTSVCVFYFILFFYAQSTRTVITGRAIVAKFTMKQKQTKKTKRVRVCLGFLFVCLFFEDYIYIYMPLYNPEGVLFL